MQEKTLNANDMTSIILNILILLNLSQVFFNGPADSTQNECSIRMIDLTQDYILSSIMEDVLGEDSLAYNNNKIFYNMNLLDYKSGTMVNVNRLSRNFVLKNDNCLGVAYYKGQYIMVNGDVEYIKRLKVLPDSISVKQTYTGPAPDGIKNWTYQIVNDNLCARFFMGMGLMLLPDFQHWDNPKKRMPIVTLPIRKTKKDKP